MFQGGKMRIKKGGGNEEGRKSELSSVNFARLALKTNRHKYLYGTFPANNLDIIYKYSGNNTRRCGQYSLDLG